MVTSQSVQNKFRVSVGSAVIFQCLQVLLSHHYRDVTYGMSILLVPNESMTDKCANIRNQVVLHHITRFLDTTS